MVGSVSPVAGVADPRDELMDGEVRVRERERVVEVLEAAGRRVDDQRLDAGRRRACGVRKLVLIVLWAGPVLDDVAVRVSRFVAVRRVLVQGEVRVGDVAGTLEPLLGDAGAGRALARVTDEAHASAHRRHDRGHADGHDEGSDADLDDRESTIIGQASSSPA